MRIDADTAVGLVVSALAERIDPERPPLLVGAEARDLLHTELGFTFANRATLDIDLAFALPDWSSWDRLVHDLEVIPDTGIAFRIAGMHVDVLGFGGIEDPEGTVTPPFRPYDAIDVYGMRPVYDTSRLAHVGDAPLRVPTAAGYVALKLKAWIDRSAVHNEKDAPDLALALFWAGEAEAFTQRFWADFALVEQWNLDAALGGAALLGGDVRTVLGTRRSDRLLSAFSPTSRERLGRAIGRASDVPLLGDAGRHLALVTALVGGLSGD